MSRLPRVQFWRLWRLWGSRALLLGWVGALGGCNEPPPQSGGTAQATLQVSPALVERPTLVTLRAEITGAIPLRVGFYRDDTLLSFDDSAPFTASLALTAPETSTSVLTLRTVSARGTVDTSRPVTLNVKITGRVMYVTPDGSSSADGLSESRPVTLRRAASLARPGDSILVKNGQYAEENAWDNVVTLRTPGRADAWIALMAYPGHSPVLRARNWNAVSVQAAYQIVEGFTVIGNRDALTLDGALAERKNLGNPVYSGNCIGASASENARPHHVVFRRNTVSNCPGGGLYTTDADYVTIEDNVVFGNAYYSPYANSGISMYQNLDSDSNRGVKNIIRRNIVYGNQNRVPFAFSSTDSITDGNGIIIDDTRHSQDNPQGPVYGGRTLIENNVVYGNGGRGIHVYESDHVDIRHNTVAANLTTASLDGGEISTVNASDVRVHNNVIAPRAGRPGNVRYSDVPAEKASQVYDFNLVWGGSGFDAGGSRNLLATDPQFENAAANNYRPRPTSPAVDAGSRDFSSAEDFGGQARPQGAAPDLGAYEVR